MKKLWIALLALALLAGFALNASALDVHFSGQYYVMGIYDDNPSLKDKNNQTIGAQAFYTQRLRLNATFQVAEGLALKIERLDILEKKWGDLSWTATNETLNRREGTWTGPTATGPRTQENVEFERAYMDFTTKIGRFLIGYQNQTAWGTDFGNSDVTHAGITYLVPVGPMILVAKIEKKKDSNSGSTPLGAGITSNSSTTDADADIYDLAAIYKFGAGEAGLLWQYVRNNATRQLNYYASFHVFDPYVKVKLGPVYVEAEGAWATGDAAKFEGPLATLPTVKVDALGLFVHARGDFGPAYAGLQFAWVRGDDPDTTDKIEGSFMATLGAGSSYDPALILWNDDMNTLIGNRVGYASVPTSTFVDNVWMYRVYAGFKPVPKADIQLSVLHAYADKKPSAAYISTTYGTEVDLVATYKIFDNLEYKIGAGYLFTGDYYKGTSSSNKIENDFLLLHKLTLTF